MTVESGAATTAAQTTGAQTTGAQITGAQPAPEMPDRAGEFIQLLTTKYVQRVSSGAEPEQLVLGAMKDILSLMVTHRGYVRVFFEHHRELPPEARQTYWS